MSTKGDPVVLVVDDESDVADAYAAQLKDRYTVLTAYSGEDALETVDETVDVVLLDRRMPGISGDDVLEQIRDRGLECRIVMVTAVDPDFDVIEMPFDDYVTKPVDSADLFESIERLLTFRSYESLFQQFYRTTRKLATLRTNKTEAELQQSDSFRSLVARRDRLRRELDQTVHAFADEDFPALFTEFQADEEASDRE